MLEPRREAVHLGGELGQRAVGGDVRADVAHRRDGFLELMENGGLRTGAAAARRQLVDLVGQAAHRVLKPDQIFRGRQVAQGVANLDEALLEIGQRGGIAAGLPAAADPLGQRADLGFERLHRLARHRVLEGAADLGKVAAQRGERVFVGLMQRGNLGGDLAKLVLERGQILRRRRPGVRDSLWGSPHGAAVERMLAGRNLRGPVRTARRRWRGRGRRRSHHHCPALRLDRRAAGLGNNLVEPAVEPRQGFADVVRGIVVAVPRRRPPLIGLREAVEIARQIVETIVDRGEIVADRLLVVSIVAM